MNGDGVDPRVWRRAAQLCTAAEPHLTIYDGPCLGHVDEAARQLGLRIVEAAAGGDR